MHFNSTEGEKEDCSSSSLPLTMPTSADAVSSGDLTTVVKKLNHNASERDRRKKLNNLYSSLRSLLPGTDHSKKLSIPVTVSRVVKYIPELQKQVERLVERKEEILSSISRKDDQLLKTNNNSHFPKQSTKGANNNNMINKQSLPSVSTNRVDDREIVIQICTLKVKRTLLSEVLLNLENEDLQIINASAFASNGDRVFYNLHLQVKENQRLECEALSEKILSLCERDVFFP